MNKLTKDLLRIFRPEGEFCQDDVCEDEFNKRCVFLCYVDNMYSAIIGELGHYEQETKDLTLIEPMVTLSEALLTLIQKKVHWCIIEYSDKEILINCNGAKNIWWQLGKGLFQQTKETQEAIYRILGE